MTSDTRRTPVATTVEFVSLELHDFIQFRGPHSFAFARSPAAGKHALTVITGGGASGKTSLVTALALALWGAESVFAPRAGCPFYLGPLLDPFAKPSRYINCEAARRSRPKAVVRLVIEAYAGDAGPTNLVVTRTWHRARRGRVRESLRVDSTTGGRSDRFKEEEAQAVISTWLPTKALPIMFVRGDHADLPERLGLGRPLAAGGRQGGSAGFIFADDPSLLESHAGLAATGDTRAPLILDAPTARMVPVQAAFVVEALSRSEYSQVVIADHECQVDELTLPLWDRVHRVYLVDDRREGRSSTLSEPGIA